MGCNILGRIVDQSLSPGLSSRPTLVGSVILTACLQLVVGCTAPVEFSNAVSEAGQVAIEERLLGNWYLANEENLTHVRIKRSDEEAETLEILVNLFDRGKQAWLRATAHPSRIGNTTYYSVRRKAGVGFDYSAEGEEPGYIVVEAKLEVGRNEDLLHIHFIRNSVIDQLLEAGRLRGRELTGVKPKGQGYGAPKYQIVDISQPDFRALLAEIPHAKLFAVPSVTLRRLSEYMPKKVQIWGTSWIPPETRRVTILYQTAVILARTGAIEEAFAALDLAEETIERADRYDRASLEDPLAKIEVLALAGQVDAALQLLSEEADPDDRDPGSQRIALALRHNGRPSEALETVERISAKHANLKVEPLLKIALSYSKRGDLVSAKQTALKAMDIAAAQKRDRQKLLKDVAVVQSRIGDRVGLQATLEAMPASARGSSLWPTESSFALLNTEQSSLRIEALLTVIEVEQKPDAQAMAFLDVRFSSA